MHSLRSLAGMLTVTAGLAALAGPAAAQPAPSAAAAPAPVPFAIADNSFFVEEAFNQERGIFQNIFGVLRINGRWNAAFTQEWPFHSQTHQLSYTLAWSDTGAASGVGDTLLNYRYQVMDEGPGRPAFAPRASLVLPTGRSADGLGSGSAGLQVNLPFSKQAGDAYLHWNAGATWLFRRTLVSPFVAGSAIYRVLPMTHLMLETVLSSDASYDETAGTGRSTSFTLSPGFRTGWNIGPRQIVAGAAVPVVWSGGEARTGVFGYFSYERPFGKSGSQP